MKEIADRLLDVLNRKGEGRTGFAQKAGISPAVLSHIASGRNAPSLDLVLSVLRIYTDVSPDWLLMGKGNWNRTAQHAEPVSLNVTTSQNSLFSQTAETKSTAAPAAISNEELKILMHQITELRIIHHLHHKNTADSIVILEEKLKKIGEK